MPVDPALLAIRFGYGLPLSPAAPATPAAMLERLTGPDVAAALWPIPGMAEIMPRLLKLGEFQKAKNEQTLIDPVLKQIADDLLQLPDLALRSTFARAISSPDSLRERLVAFWTDHFTVLQRPKYIRMLPYAMVEDCIRPNLTGAFGEMLTAVTLSPAMLVYLDQSSSVGPNSRLGQRKNKGLNENLARELIELHSLGVAAAYSQADVTQMAELLTGLSFDLKRGLAFDPQRVEPGAETVLGHSYGGEGMAPILQVLHDLALRPETAAHIARKLAVHFVSDDPSPALVAAIEAAYNASGGRLIDCYSALLNHPDASALPLQKARQPYDFVLAGLRAMAVSGADLLAMERKAFQTLVAQPMAAMGQPYQRALGPNGWPEQADAWITPQGLAQRITWAMQVPKRIMPDLPDPTVFAQNALGDLASPDLMWAAARAEDRAQGIGLVLASADFNRR